MAMLPVDCQISLSLLTSIFLIVTGKPSGIMATESDYWFHNLCIGDETFCTLVFDVNSLRKIINNLDSKKIVKGGDHYASRMYLLNLQKLFSSDVIKTFKGS